MTATTDAGILQRCTFFECFQPKHLEKVSKLAYRAAFSPDEVIFREGDASSKFYVILSGRVALEAVVKGRTQCVQTLFSGDELGWSAMLNGCRQFQARAVEAVDLLVFEAAHLREACDSNPYFARAFLERLLLVVAERLQSTRLQLVAALAAGPEAAVPAMPGP